MGLAGLNLVDLHSAGLEDLLAVSLKVCVRVWWASSPPSLRCAIGLHNQRGNASEPIKSFSRHSSFVYTIRRIDSGN